MAGVEEGKEVAAAAPTTVRASRPVESQDSVGMNKSYDGGGGAFVGSLTSKSPAKVTTKARS
jgi:hypothetical protein